MTTTNHDPRTVLTVPWLVAEPDQVPIVPAEAAPVATNGNKWQRNPRPFYVSIAASVAWCIVVAVTVLSGAMFPLAGNALAYVVLMAGLFCAAFVALTCPRPDGDETFITLSGYPVGQCTPSRNTLTGRAQ